MSRVRTPSATPHCVVSPPPNFAAWIRSVHAVGTEAAVLQPCPQGASSAASQGASLLGRGRDPRVPLVSLNPNCTPKGHKLFLQLSPVAELLKTDCAVPERQRRGAERGSPCPAVRRHPRGRLGTQGAPGTPGGSGLQTPSSPSPLPA